MSQSTNPDFESKHDRGHGGKFTKMDRGEVDLDLDSDRDDQIARMNAYWQENWGTDADPRTARSLDRYRETLSTRCAPVDYVNFNGPGSSAQVLTVQDNDGTVYGIETISRFTVKTRDGDIPMNQWEDESPYKVADRTFREVSPDIADDDEFSEWSNDPDGFTIRKYDEKRERMEREYSIENAAAVRKAAEDDKGNVEKWAEWRDYNNRYQRFPDFQQSIENRRRQRDGAVFHTETTTKVYRNDDRSNKVLVDKIESQHRDQNSAVVAAMNLRDEELNNAKPENQTY